MEGGPVAADGAVAHAAAAALKMERGNSRALGFEVTHCNPPRIYKMTFWSLRWVIKDFWLDRQE